ncbi:hypothetical protein PTKIN_Ptkin14bG0141000 [Pterospermum kingtungense]
MCDFVRPILEVVKFIGRPAKKYLDYDRKFSNYVDDFRQAQEELRARQVDIQQQLQDEHRFGKKPKQEVENWLKVVAEKISHAQGVEDRVSKGKWFFHSFLGKIVDEATHEIKEVYAKGQFSNGLVVNDPSTTKVKLPTEELAGATKVEEVYRYLMEDGVRKIGVCGMGGVGKTTIMKHVHNKLLEETKFSKLIWTTVSQDFNIRTLQERIACQLGEELNNNEETTTRAAKLSEMLRKQGRYVLILDDVWSSFSLNDVGILEPTADNGCKLVLTTRSEEVVRSMGCKKVEVVCLSANEALQLFLSKVGQDLLPNPKIESIMELIVEECAGLPLAIVTVAGTMKGIYDPLRWEISLKTLRGQTRNMKDVEDKVFGCLVFSYEHLETRDKYCFLHCALFPEDYEFDLEEIIERWIEDGLMDEMGTRKEMQDFGHVVLEKLKENCLLERVHYGDGDCIKMHDVVRDMALHITKKSSTRFFVKAGMQLTELPDEQQWTEDLEKVSLMRNSITTIPPSMLPFKCEKLTTLLLSNNPLKEIPDSFFDHMPNLKILDLSFSLFESLPNSLSNLKNLTTLLLSYCTSLENVPSLSKLKALKKLDLRYTSIKKIPQGLEELINLRYLNLGFTESLIEISKELLSKLCRLQYLVIHPVSIGMEEIRELNKLEVFEGCFFNMHDLSKYVGERKRLHNYLIWVTKELSHPFRDVYLDVNGYSKWVIFANIDMNSGDGIILPYDIQELQVVSCEGMTSLNDIRGWDDATNLKECAIFGCDEVEYIFLSKCHQFETLESLELHDLENLKGIVREPLIGTFSSLKQIIVYECRKIKNLFSSKWVLQNLEEIIVTFCEEIEEIIVSEEEGAGTFIKHTFPKLRKLDLMELPELKRICSKNGVMVCDSLQDMMIRHCPKLKRIPLYLHLLDLDNTKPSPPPSLKQIIVHPKECLETMEWDNPHANNALRPFFKFWDDRTEQWKQAV